MIGQLCRSDSDSPCRTSNATARASWLTFTVRDGSECLSGWTERAGGLCSPFRQHIIPRLSNSLLRCGIICALAIAPALRPAIHAQATGVDTSVEATVSAARTYLARYQTDLTFILADEIAKQQVLRQEPAVPKAIRNRTTSSEVYFKFVEADGSWMAIRNVSKVDGVPVEDRPDLRAALLNQNAAQVARTFKAFNSQFNIGRLFRNFNEPTLALAVLDAKRATTMEFSRKGVRVRDGVALVTIGFKERRSPEALIYDLLMRPAPVDGEVVIEAGTGRVRRTVLKVTVGSVKAELATVYELDAKLDLWVPVNFLEFYEDGIPQTGTTRLSSPIQYEAIKCESRYTGFRRFTATATIK